ncbi:MAG: hypothetical protein O2904_04325 [bacterium]|nr:hypothetical protein [bacterium]
MLATIAFIAALSGFAIPVYRDYLIRNDLNIAAEQTIHILRRAQMLSEAGEQSAQWGVSVTQGTLFAGSSYALRDAQFDEMHPFAPNINVSGVTEVVYSKVYGVPSQSGDVVLTAVNGDNRIIEIRPDRVLAGPPVPPIRMKIVFEYIKNSGKGSVTPTVHVGSIPTEFGDGAWFSLTENGVALSDDSLILDVGGVSVQRQSGYVRVLNFGGLDSGGKEVVDVRITLDGADIAYVLNDLGVNEAEQPFDGNVNEGVGGDEVEIASDSGSLLFQTRVTNAGDAILIYWSQANP